jgi:hypothetical protein
MSPIAIVVIVVGIAVFLYARRKHRQQLEIAQEEAIERELYAVPRLPSAEQIIDSVAWWSTSRLWGPTVRGQSPPPFDQFAGKPRAIVGSGRGRIL